MDKAYACSTQEALEAFKVVEQDGLSAQQVQTSREKHGRNGKVQRMFLHHPNTADNEQQHYLKIHQLPYGNLFLSSSKTSL